MTLEEAMEAIISKAEALRELSKHGFDDPSEFFADVGECDAYKGDQVLIWLGY